MLFIFQVERARRVPVSWNDDGQEDRSGRCLRSF